MMNKEKIIDILKYWLISVTGGCILSLALFAFEPNPFKDSDFEVIHPSNRNEIEDQIHHYILNDYDEQTFPILLTSINASKEYGSIQHSTASHLKSRLSNAYRTHIFNMSEALLINGDDDYEVHLELLENLENTLGKDEEIDYYIEQIDRSQYYYDTFPSIIENYLNTTGKRVVNVYQSALMYFDFAKGDYYALRRSFNKATIAQYIAECTHTPGLDSKYKNKDLANQLDNYARRLIDIQKKYSELETAYSGF